jgi:hypothetical protein
MTLPHEPPTPQSKKTLFKPPCTFARMIGLDLRKFLGARQQ